MPYALVEDIPASWEGYAAIGRRLGSRPPGLLVHVAGPTEEGFRIIEVWETEADWQRFAAELELELESIDPAGVSRTVGRDLRVVHALLGDRPGGNDPAPAPSKGGDA